MTVYSHSRLSTFENCPLKYKFQYIDKLRSEEEGIEAFVGSRFHDTMEALYKELKFKVTPLPDLLKFYDEEWHKNMHENVVVVRKDRKAQDYYDMGKTAIENYYKRYNPFNQSRVIGVEQKIMVDLNEDGKYNLVGYIDRIGQREDGTYEIHDYKTGGKLPLQSYLDEDRQLALYQIGLRQMWPKDVKNVELIWHYVVFDKSLVSTRTESQLAELKAKTIKLIDELEATEEFLPQESTLCEWCDNQELCPKRKHYTQVKDLPANKYLKDSGVKLVNEFAKLDLQIKEYKEKIEELVSEEDKIAEAVIKYGEKEKLEVIVGSDYQLKIKESSSVTAPKKGSEERKTLEEIIKREHKWDEVASLDTNEIKKVILEERWEKSIIKKIKDYFNIESKKKVTLSKKKEER